MSAAKKAKRSAPLFCVTAKEQEKQHVHLESKKYAAKKELRKAKNSSSNAPSTSQQMALGMVSQGISLVS